MSDEMAKSAVAQISRGARSSIAVEIIAESLKTICPEVQEEDNYDNVDKRRDKLRSEPSRLKATSKKFA